ncbi:hypothetical protein DFR24_2677 [Panacagrimonas perspica]|uniref:TonB family protein n=1 Tax=Panacagrimonas perspica TaxID=381431 RepID=A0A4R7P4I5_9GAMM|nr:hypothetical protein [Panacagrimonas perspica]TDU28309.1 hypothetical protein DFR24_2677 [Panacagrimonas perspica]THD02463.1 hypothetical protein B1810_14595 [Panacagrimonas perspica]
MRAVLYSIFFVCIAVIVSTVMLGYRARLLQTMPARPPTEFPPEGEYEIPPVPAFPSDRPAPAKSTPAVPAAPVETDPRPARPRMDFLMRQKIDTERFNRVLKRFYPGELDAPDAALRLVIRVGPDGKVEDAKTEESTFARPEFEAALIDEVKRTKYPEDDRYRSTSFAFEFKSVKPLPRRPLAEAEAGRDALLARIEKRRAAIFATSAVPADAGLKVVYRVLPSGAVDEAKVASSSYRSTAFGRAVVEEIRKLRFAANPAYAPTEFTYEYAEGSAGKGNSGRP